ncbi:MAG: bifunctional homocysteine S-methyltransferase/methylenetetrahydrofolate reductase [Planctomycetes bacterium]|nr:bifunctional homocysteine S-methyltransferase/methylenetetrahydrofolate reductase [Planctomycetota bacterium]
MNAFLDALKSRVLVGDGAYGTLFSRRGLLAAGHMGAALNLAKPGFVKAIHEEYLRAGAEVIETNTFGASRHALEAANLGDRVVEVCRAGAKIARDAAAGKAYVLGAIGPLPRASAKLGPEERRDAYAEQIKGLIEGGVDGVLLETFSDLDELTLAIEAANLEGPKTPLIAQLAFSLSGSTATGVSPERMVAGLKKLRVDVIGANCGGGETAAIEVVKKLADLTDKPISVYPNRGLADFDDVGRPIYIQRPDYFARSAKRLADLGANLIGGCCGTTPDDIRALKALITARKPSLRSHAAPVPAHAKAPAKPLTVQATLEADFKRGGVIVAEVDPPRGVYFDKQVMGARTLHEAGVHAITIADNPLSVMRMSNLAFANMVTHDCGARIVLHVACRDRSLIGTQSHLLGAYAMGVSNILAVTGDPVATQAYQGSSGVFDMSSAKLIEMISGINRGDFTAEHDGDLRTNFFVGCAFNSATRSMDNEAKRLGRKVAAGARFVMTQPVYSLDTARAVAAAIAPLQVPVLLGLMPLVSERNAEFLHNEVPGISIPDPIRARMAGKSGKKGREEGLAICRELMEQTASQVAGFYLITPMDRYEMVAALTQHAHSLRRKN